MPWVPGERTAGWIMGSSCIYGERAWLIESCSMSAQTKVREVGVEKRAKNPCVQAGLAFCIIISWLLDT